MKILVHDYAGHPGQVQLSRELARRGHEVTHAYAGGLLTPRGALARRDDDPSAFAVEEVPMDPEYRAKKYSFFARRRMELEYGRALRAVVRRLRPEVVISANTPTEPQWIMTRGARRLGVPVVTWVQDFYSIAVERLARKKAPLLGRLAGAWYRHLDGRCFRASAGIVAITRDFVPILKRFGVDEARVSVVPNWAPLDEMPLRPKDNAWARARGWAGKFVFLYSGTLAMKHNPDLLRRLALRFRDDPEVVVAVVSEGPGAEFLAARRREEGLDNLALLPFQPYEEMPDVMASADVLVAVLEEDAGVFSVPSKVLSYHCAGRPVLAAMPLENLAARILAEEDTGLCVAPRDADAFVAAAVRLRGEAGLRRSMGARARAYAERAFDIRAVAARFEHIACSAIDPAARARVSQDSKLQPAGHDAPLP